MQPLFDLFHHSGALWWSLCFVCSSFGPEIRPGIFHWTHDLGFDFNFAHFQTPKQNWTKRRLPFRSQKQPPHLEPKEDGRDEGQDLPQYSINDIIFVKYINIHPLDCCSRHVINYCVFLGISCLMSCYSYYCDNSVILNSYGHQIATVTIKTVYLFKPQSLLTFLDTV